MSEDTLKYGIDLGTTNSAICRLENGKPRIIKSDQFQKDTTPSCVSINKKQVITVGDQAYLTRHHSFAKLVNNPEANVDDSFIEFKRTMGSDKEYGSLHLGRSLTSEELSAEVLKKLKSYVRDDEVYGAVITHPAKFTQAQVDATKRAVELVGFQSFEFLMEPIAASIAYGIKAESADGKWLVFDFGGGTFDVALMSVEEGVMKVLDTEGDNYLGGKNLDLAIIDKIIIPHLKENHAISSHLETDEKTNILKDFLKRFAEETRTALSSSDSHLIYCDDFIEEDDDGNEVDLDLTVSLSDYEEITTPIFQTAIDIAKKLVERNNLTSKELKNIVMVGGPTFSQTCRKMLKDQLDCPIDVSIDPMTCVADGAAIFASTRSLPDDLKVRNKTKIQLNLQHEESTVEVEQPVAVSVDEENTEGEIPEKLFIEIANQDDSWASDRSEIVGGSEVIFAKLNEGTTNLFEIRIYDEQGTNIPCQPGTFSILQGIKIAAPVMSYIAGLGTTDLKTNKHPLALIEGLEKNQKLPAKGKGTWKTISELRPGNPKDILHLPVFEGEYEDDGANTDLCTMIADGYVTGDELSGFVPADSEVEVTIKVDMSRLVTGSVFFKHTDDHVDIHFNQLVDTIPAKDYLNELINRARNTLTIDENELFSSDEDAVKNLIQKLDDLEEQLEQGGSDDDTRKQIDSNLKITLKEIDRLEQEGEWPKVVEEMKQELKYLNDVQAQYGDEKTKEHVSELKNKSETIIAEKDTRMAKKLVNDINTLKFALLRQDPNYYISIISRIDRNFDMHNWKNPSQARQLLEAAKRSIAARDFTVKSLNDQLSGIFDCMQDPRKVREELVDTSRVTRID